MPTLPIAEPIKDCIACQFQIDPNVFVYIPDTSLNPPELPGLPNLAFSFGELVIESILFFLKPINFILTLKIPQLFEWISIALIDPIQFILDAIMMIIIDPLAGKLKIYVPPFSLPVPGLPTISVPAINPGLPGFDGNLQWLAQIPAFMGFFFLILLFPIKVMLGLFQAILKFELPALNFDFFKKLFDAIIPTLGLPTIAAIELVVRFSECFLKSIGDILAIGVPAYPAETGASLGGEPPKIEVTIDPSNQFGEGPSVITDKGVWYSPIDVQGVIVVRIKNVSGGSYSFAPIETRDTFGVENDFVFNSPAFSLADLDQTEEPLIYLAQYFDLDTEGTVIIKLTDPNVKPFTFTVKSKKRGPLTLLKQAYKSPRAIPKYPGEFDYDNPSFPETNFKFSYGNKQKFLDSLEVLKTAYADAYDPEINIFGIRAAEACTDEFEDLIGISWKNPDTGIEEIYTWQATTRPGKTHTDAMAIDPLRNPKGVDTLYLGFYPVLWKPGDHTPTGAPIQTPSLVEANGSQYPPAWCITFRDKDKIGSSNTSIQPSIYYCTKSINCHTVYAVGRPNIAGSSAGCQVLRFQNDYFNKFHPKLLLKENVVRSKTTPEFLPLNGNVAPLFFSYYLMLKSDVEDLWTLINPYNGTKRDSDTGLISLT